MKYLSEILSQPWRTIPKNATTTTTTTTTTPRHSRAARTT
jgi:hypothetical protein